MKFWLTSLRLAALGAFAVQSAEILPPGRRPSPPGVHALVGATIVVKPGESIAGATVVIRDGFIEAVGRELRVPADARVWRMNGTTIYAGFIDPYLTLTSTNTPVANRRSDFELSGASGALNFYGVSGKDGDSDRAAPGYPVARVDPETRAVRDFSPDPKSLGLIRELGFAAGNVVPQKGIVRGTSAFVALSDVPPNEAVIRNDTFQHVAFEADGGKDGEYPNSLMGVIAVVRQALLDAKHYATNAEHYRQHPQNRKRPEFDPALEALGPALARKMPVVIEPGSALMVDRAARIARELDLDFLLVSSGQEWRRPDLAKAAGVVFIVPLNFSELPRLPEDDDWEAISLDQFRAWDWAPENPALLRTQGLDMALTTYGLSERKNFRKNLGTALDRGLTQNDALAALTTIPARICGVSDRLGTIEAGKIANLTVVEGDGYFRLENRVREVWIDGRVYRVDSGPAKSAAKSEPAIAGTTGAAAPDDGRSGPEKKEARERELRKVRVARSPLAGRGPLAGPNAVLVRGATIWTCGPSGNLDEADLLVVAGKVRAVGKDLAAPADAGGDVLTVDGRGRHVTPGIVDAHNHSMILGAVNEATLPSTAMVRIGDVINSESLNLHKQLAGGLTTINLLHGSANPIGGQNAVLKLRDGASPEGLVLSNAPPGIKFALGENVKQSNAGPNKTTRFPQTRMGVRTFFANRFSAAQEYLKEWEDYAKSGSSSTLPPPRRNLELEAIGEILKGRRWIHCHSYRQDEILSFLRTMENFGVRIATLQHVLEGYKVADEIARHGAGASMFSDWWAYKFEVYDAIPYNGSLMRDRGVLVSFNSDSSDLARRLYLEAAKAVKYGGTPEIEALKFATINPARQLHIDPYVGSLEPGKDGDFVIWSRSPLDSTTVCLQTWIEGNKYFDRDHEGEHAEALEKERTDLREKAKKLQPGGGAPEAGEKEKNKFLEQALEHRHDNRDRHCLEEE